MYYLSEITKTIRSKNAGPFWVTIDLFCGDDINYQRVKNGLTIPIAANHLLIAENLIKRFEIDDLRVIKISFQRKNFQGSRLDRDMHGAKFAHIFSEIQIN
mgnify:FL=1